LSEERDVILKVLSILATHLETVALEIREALRELGPEPAVPEIDLESLPWKRRDKTPSKPGEWGWLFGPASKVGPPKGSEPLILLLDRHGGRVELPPYEITYARGKAFIQRRPIKEGAK